jgi:hypothetical protein
MSDKPEFARIEMRPHLMVPMCSPCGELRGRKERLVVVDDAKPHVDTWVCPKCKDEIDLPPGFPRMKYEMVDVQEFQLPNLNPPPPSLEAVDA